MRKDRESSGSRRARWRESRPLQAGLQEFADISVQRKTWLNTNYSGPASAKGASITAWLLSKILFPAEQQDCHRSRLNPSGKSAYFAGSAGAHSPFRFSQLRKSRANSKTPENGLPRARAAPSPFAKRRPHTGFEAV